MILGFKKTFPWGEPTNFKEKILSGQKIHSIRSGARWSAGMPLHMATGVRTKQYEQFNNGVEGLGVVTSVQMVNIAFRSPEHCWIAIDHCIKYSRAATDTTEKNTFSPTGEVEVPKHMFGVNFFEQFYKNDGFDTAEDFWKFFNAPFVGQLIHWTPLKY